eukprot:TRINITY_DN23828_c0_g1_i1.p1 TRINITY_DN23828_c0_g1~~TRINITY_DN23828_c0_g1_i1.p1  ORF type:complete len:797 (-),score=153.24 TRINITY_DN23828_c0_g1_i1:30-2420(-)
MASNRARHARAAGGAVGAREEPTCTRRNSFDDRVQNVRSQIRSLMESDEENFSGSEWFEGDAGKVAGVDDLSAIGNEGHGGSTTGSSILPPSSASREGATVIGREVIAQVGQRVYILDSKLADSTDLSGTITEIRCGGGRVQVTHDGTGAQRYYNTGKDQQFHLALSTQLSRGVPRMTLPQAPAEVEKVSPPPAFAGTPASAATSETTTSVSPRQRYSEIRRSRLLQAQEKGQAAAPAQTSAGLSETASNDAASSRQRYSEARRSMIQAPSCNSSSVSGLGAGDTSPRPQRRQRYSELRKASVSPVPAPASHLREAALAADYPGVAVSEEQALQAAAPLPATHDPTGHADSTGQVASALPFQAGARHVDRRASRSPSLRRVVPDFSRAIAKAEEQLREPCPDLPAEPSRNALRQQEDMGTTPALKARQRPSATKQRAPKEDEHAAETSRRLEVLERETASLRERLEEVQQSKSSEWERLREENRRQIERTERRIIAQIMEELEGKVRIALEQLGMGQKLSHADEPAPAQEPEQEYDGGESPRATRLRSAPAQESSDQVMKRISEVTSAAELADSTHRLEAIGSIARHVSASLGGAPETACEATPSQSTDRQLSTEQLEQELAHLADMRRYASKVLGKPLPSREQEAASQASVTRERQRPQPWEGPVRVAQKQPETPSFASFGAAGISSREKEWPDARSCETLSVHGHPCELSHPVPDTVPSPAFGNRDDGRKRVSARASGPSAERWKRRPSSTSSRAASSRSRLPPGPPSAPWEEDAVARGADPEQEVDSEGRWIF